MPGFFHNTWASLCREMTRIRRQPMYFTLMVVLPIVSFLFFAALFEHGVARDIPSPSSMRTAHRSRARSPA